MSQQISSENVIGRDQLIASIWQRIKLGKSIRLTAERRIGKTTVMKKMRDESSDCIAIFIDLERVDSPIRFVEVLAVELRQITTLSNRTLKWVERLLPSELSAGDFSIKIPEARAKEWREELEALFDHICSNNEERIVLLLDELPYMLQKIFIDDQRSHSHNAIEILDLLRAVRQKYPKLQMVFAGSVGIHHVIKELKGKSSASQPINDLEAIDVQPLSQEYAIQCAKKYCQDYGVTLNNDLLSELAVQCNGAPFYIDKVISALELQSGNVPVTLDFLNETLRVILTDDTDRWEMRHFKDRLSVYYVGTYPDANEKPQDLHQLAATVLDILAISKRALSIEQVFEEAKAHHAITHKKLIIDLLADLSQDHYLRSTIEANGTKKYSFKYKLIQTWWCISQGLNPLLEHE